MRKFKVGDMVIVKGTRSPIVGRVTYLEDDDYMCFFNICIDINGLPEWYNTFQLMPYKTEPVPFSEVEQLYAEASYWG